MIKELIRAGSLYLKHHQEHHPVYCIGKCDPVRCGQDAFGDALAEAGSYLAAAQEQMNFDEPGNKND